LEENEILVIVERWTGLEKISFNKNICTITRYGSYPGGLVVYTENIID
jgi:hypothetical protein